MLADKKKKKVSKKSKRAWRKHTDVKDVEDFLEEKRCDERLGIDKISSKKDSELFVLDSTADVSTKKKQGKPRTKKEKKLWALEPSTYQLSLIPRSAVEDPIKRNRVKTKEERKHPARKAKDLELRLQGKLRAKQALAIKNRKQSLKNNKKLPIKEKIASTKFNSDLWNDVEKSKVDDSWLNYDAKRQALKTCGEYKVKPPVDLRIPRSQLPKVETPHPGLSYNPSLADHKDLIKKVVDKELEMMKVDAHLARKTAKIKSARKETDEWVEEILQSLGIIKEEEEEEAQKIDVLAEEDEENSKAGIVKKQPKMKTRKQRRAQKRIREEAQERKYAATERRKTSDICKIKSIVSDIDVKTAENNKKLSAKREATVEHKRIGTKRLARLKFQEPLQDFTSTHELTGSLRKLRAKSTLLRDRFFSLQKRNILQPTARIFKTKKRKVKAVVKRDHRIDEEMPRKSKSRKIKIINSG